MGKWPKTFPPLTAEQQAIADDFMNHWLEVLPNRYGIIERFNHTYPVKNAPSQFLRTLEIGAGRGEHLDYEKITPEQRRNYFMVELMPQLCQIMRQRFPDMHVVETNCQKTMDFQDGFFDRVLAIHVLEHLPDLPSAVKECYRLCRKPGGVLSIVIPCEGSLAYGMARRVSAQRIFEKRYKTSYDWYIRQNHVNRPAEILEELHPYFQVASRSFFPMKAPWLFCNLVIGLTLEVRSSPQGAP